MPRTAYVTVKGRRVVFRSQEKHPRCSCGITMCYLCNNQNGMIFTCHSCHSKKTIPERG
jgi:hypothetical protein